MSIQRAELNHWETRVLFLKHNIKLVKGNLVFKAEEENPVFLQDWHCSHFIFMNSKDTEFTYGKGNHKYKKKIESVNPEERQKRLIKLLKEAFPENAESILKIMTNAYTQSMVCPISFHLFGVKKELIFKKGTINSAAEHHIVKKVFLQKDRIYLTLENNIQGADCKVIAHYVANKDGQFVLDAPIEFIGNDALFVHALAIDDYVKIDKYWPLTLDKTIFDDFVDDLSQQLNNARDYLNSFLKTQHGKERINNKAFLTAIQNFHRAFGQEISKSEKLTREQKLLLTETLQKVTWGIQIIDQFDSLRFLELTEKFKGNNNFRLIFATLAALALISFCILLTVMAASSFGAGTPIVLGSLILAYSLSTAIQTTIAALLCGGLAGIALFFLHNTPKTFLNLANECKALSDHILAADIGLKFECNDSTDSDYIDLGSYTTSDNDVTDTEGEYSCGVKIPSH